MPITSHLLESATPPEAPKPKVGFHVVDTSRTFIGKKEADGAYLWRSNALFRHIINTPSSKAEAGGRG